MKTKYTSLAVGLAGRKNDAWVAALPGRRWLVRRLLVLVFSALVLGSSAVPSQQARLQHFALAVAGHSWDLVGWEVNALREKVVAVLQRPADEVTEAIAPGLVQEYLARAQRIGEIEEELARNAVLPPGGVDENGASANTQLSAELRAIRAQQEFVRPQVEQVIERQVNSRLRDANFWGVGDMVWPPVSFTFVEPPKKLVVSRRDRIDTIYSQMLEAEISLAETEAAEAEIDSQYNASGYVTEIGGLGAFPTMVVDRASLRWVLSTVAHEWAHNYLVFYPLGWNYFKSQELTTINETVAEIVGNEIGDQTLVRYYLEPAPAIQPVAPPSSPEPPPFDFRVEMRTTRLEVDRLLAAGDVAGAEAYMEERRRLFIESGYTLRVLNQAYFAFHGSYGTSPASTSPIGPKIDRLRQLMPDLETFLKTVRSFTEVDDLDRTLADWEARANAPENTQ